jgi:hypothetical protein
LLVPVVHRLPVAALATVVGASPSPRAFKRHEPGVRGSSRPGSPSSTSSPVSWRRVENEAELAYSQFATVERMLHDTLASVQHNILRSIEVSLRKRKTDDPVHTRSAFLRAHLPSPCIAPPLFISGQCRHNCPAGRGGTDTRAITITDLACAATVLVG